MADRKLADARKSKGPKKTLAEHILDAPKAESDEEWELMFGYERPKTYDRPDPFAFDEEEDVPR